MKAFSVDYPAMWCEFNGRSSMGHMEQISFPQKLKPFPFEEPYIIFKLRPCNHLIGMHIMGIYCKTYLKPKSNQLKSVTQHIHVC